MIAITSNWKNDYAPQNVTRKRSHRFGLQVNSRCALSEIIPAQINYSKTNNIKPPIEFDLMTTCILLSKCINMFVHKARFC